MFLGRLQTILGQKWQRDGLVDNTDLLLPKKVRRIVFESQVPLKTRGSKRAMVFTSTKPDIYTSADIPEQDRKDVQYFDFEYPASSLQSMCVLQVLYRQDALLADKWQLVRTHFECGRDRPPAPGPGRSLAASTGTRPRASCSTTSGTRTTPSWWPRR